MRSLRDIFIILMLVASMTACGLPAQTTLTNTLELRQTIVWPSVTASPTSTQTSTPTPTLTSTPTPLVTNTPTVLPTLTPTTLPLNFQLQVFEDVWSVVNEEYLYSDFNGVDWEAVRVEFQERIAAGLDNSGFYTAMYEMIDRLGDEHSSFLSPMDVAQQEATYAGQYDYVGIGLLHLPIPERQYSVVLSVFQGSPAEAAGLRSRDIILKVDGEPILDENGIYHDKVRGPAGTDVTLLVQTPGQAQRQVTITRQRITGSVPIPHQVLSSSNGLRIGYIFLFGFDDSTIDEQVAEALEDMSAQDSLDGLILDLRLNGGGTNTVAEPILSYVTQGIVGFFIYRNEQRPLSISPHDINGSQDVPLVVLVGPDTVSFGEIFSGVLQDSGRAYIIGTTTDGNVEVLWSYSFDDGSELWLASETFRPYYHPDQDWETTGIIPDMIVPGDFDENPIESDPPVVAAMEYLDALP